MTTATFDDVFAAAEFGDPDRSRVNRPKVEVPESALALVRKAQAEGKRIYLPVKSPEHYEQLANVFYSSGDLLDPPASLLCTPMVREKGADDVVRWTKVPANEATHLRASVGQRRGKRTTD